MRLLNQPNRTAAGLALAMLVLGLINILAWRNAGQLAAETTAAAHTYEIIIDLRGLLARTVDAETGQRGFVITGDERYLEPYGAARASIDAELASLRAAISAADQRARLASLEALTARRLAQIEAVVDLRRSGGFLSAANRVASNSGKATQDEIRALVVEMERAELALLDQRVDAARVSASNTNALIFLGSGLAFVAAMAAVIATRRQSLSAGEDRFRQALDDAPLPVFIHAEDYSVLFANRAFGEATGANLANFTSLARWLNTSPAGPGTRERIARLYAGATRSENIEHQVTLADGQERTWLISSAGLGPGPDGRRQAITMIVDLTDRKRAEAALAASANRLRDLSLHLVEVQERERRTIARELHDEIGQALTGLDLVLEMATRAPEHGLRQNLRTAQGYVRDLTSRVRNLSLDLRPSMLDDLGLVPALRWLFQRYTEQTSIAVDFRYHNADRRFPPAIETAAYREIQEALTNVARHAGVPLVTVRLWGEPSRLLVQIEDSGNGFDVQAALSARRSTGLESMRERAELLGGVLTLDSAPGQGTTIMVDLPLEPAVSPAWPGSPSEEESL